MTSSLKNTAVNDTGYVQLPVGTTNQRPTVSFTTVGTTSWIAPPGVTSIAVLVVAGGGGGGGGSYGGGGGGAGGLVYNSSYTVVPGNSYTITVGAGGNGGLAGTSSTGQLGTNGSNSVFDTLTAIGGGRGGVYNTTLTTGAVAGSGGSGGGGGSYTAYGAGGASTQNSAGSTGFGNIGGTGANASYDYGGGGGGAGAIGGTGTSGQGGNGGAGLSYSISGIPTYYAGGGGGGVYSGVAGIGGAGGGGAGLVGNPGGSAIAGKPNTGGGGGGGNVGSSSVASNGGAGGSGIVIISWSPVVGGTIRYNTTTKTVETYTGFRDQPSLGTTNWTANNQALQNLQNSGLVTRGLACLLDAGNVISYPGQGNVWYDISGNNRHFYINSSFATWTSAGTASYFTVSGGNNSSRDQAAFIGPASDAWGFDQEHFFEFILNNVSATTNQLFMFSPNAKNQDPVGAQNLLQSHWYYSNGNTYYDVYGCCGGQQRVYVNNNVWGAAGTVQHVSYRTRPSEYPNRSVFHNSSTVIDSGQNPTDTAIWDKQDPAILCVGSNLKIYYVAIYNRALTDTERAANYAVLQSRYGIS